MLFKLSVKFGIAPRLISMSFLNSNDKEDMLEGVLGYDELEASVGAWKDNGMPNISDIPIPAPDYKKQVDRKWSYRSPFIDPREVSHE
jgi:hypothetical protein